MTEEIVNAPIKETLGESEALLETTKDVVIKQQFIELVEMFLNEEPDKMTIQLSPDIKKYLFILCKESPELFESFESSLKQIILDNKIDTKDIPEILILVNRVYSEINSKQKLQINIDPYELVKTLLHVVFVVYVETNKVENSELLLNVLNIIDASIGLIKLKPTKPLKVGCFTCLF